VLDEDSEQVIFKASYIVISTPWCADIKIQEILY